jgi:hypothetical protein
MWYKKCNILKFTFLEKKKKNYLEWLPHKGEIGNKLCPMFVGGTEFYYCKCQ